MKFWLSGVLTIHLMCFCFAAFFEPDEIHYPAIDIAMNETSICSSFPIIYIGQRLWLGRFPSAAYE
jgi:hypothetical protein